MFLEESREPTEHILVKASVLTEKGKHIFMFLEESREPTEHILNEMIEQKEAFEKLGDKVIFVVRTEAALKDPNIARALRTFPEIQVYFEIEQKEAFEKLGDKVIFVVRTEAALKDPNIARALRTFPEIQVYFDSRCTLTALRLL